MPETLADIKSGHNEVYEKRHKRIEEKKAVLLAQEKAAQEAARPEEPQAETYGRATRGGRRVIVTKAGRSNPSCCFLPHKKATR